MGTFKVVLIEHSYGSVQCEREIIEAAGGELIDADKLSFSEALELCETADAVMFRRATITADVIRRFQKCKAIVRYGVGTDNVDVAAATQAGIVVCHVPAYCLDEVSTHAVALLLACVRRIVSTHQKMQEGGWDVHRDEPIYRLAGKTLGIIGLGNIGQAVARKLQGWNLNLIAVDPFVTRQKAEELNVELVNLQEVCRRSDFISLHCPLLPETHHLISSSELALMKPTAILVNTARGKVVDTQALLEALNGGQIAGAALDVFEEEPLAVESPFRRHPRLLVTDHTAWYSEESQRQLQITAAEEVSRVCTGVPPRSLVNPELLSKLPLFKGWEPPPNVRWQLERLHRLRSKSR